MHEIIIAIAVLGIIIILIIYLVFKLKAAKKRRVIIKTAPQIIDMLSKIGLSKIIEEANGSLSGIKYELKTYLDSKSKSNLKKVTEKLNVNDFFKNKQTSTLIGILNGLLPLYFPVSTFNNGTFVLTKEFRTLIMKNTCIREYCALIRTKSIYMLEFADYIFAGFIKIVKPTSIFQEMVADFIVNINNLHYLNRSYGYAGIVLSKYLFFTFVNPMPLDMYFRFLDNNEFVAYSSRFALKFVGNGNYIEEKFEIVDEVMGFKNARYKDVCFMVFENLNYKEDNLHLILLKTDEIKGFVIDK